MYPARQWKQGRMPGEADGPVSEIELLRSCQAGDARAAKELVRLCEPQMLRVASRLVGRRDVAEEIVQEAFYRTFREIDRIDGERGPRGFMLRTVMNLGRSHLRRYSTAETPADIDPDAQPIFHAEATDPEINALGGELSRHVDAAIARLTPKLREVALLRFVEGLSFDEVARILRVPSAILRMRALRARSQMREMLAELVR